MSRPWSTVADIRSRVRRRWDDGTLLKHHARGMPFPRIEVPLRGPRAGEIGDDLEAVRSWIAALDAGRRGGAHYELSHASVGGRMFGRNEVPHRAVVSEFAQAWAVLGVAEQVRRFEEILEVAGQEPVLREWVCTQPLRALQIGDGWAALPAAYRWLQEERGSGRYLREVTAPGVDTKFIEQHRAVLARLMEVPTSATGFVAGLGLAARPETVRLRVDPALGLAGGFTEVVVRLEELTAAKVDVRTAVIVENEVTYLSVPVPEGGVVLWGKGFEVNRAGSLPWLREAEVHYWGDLDTHGFAILNQLRAWLPQTRSFLMDRATLLEHRDRWGAEPSPTTAGLDRLTTEEAGLYSDLVADRLGDRLRLEQERIDWAWVRQRLPYR